jgi:hypothetical protein
MIFFFKENNCIVNPGALWLVPVILTTWEVEILIQGQPMGKVIETSSQPIMLGMVVQVHHPSYTRGINRRIVI